MPSVEALKLARATVDAAADKKADDILLLDLRALSSVADYFVICTGNNDRQLGAIADNVEEHLRWNGGARPLHIEGAGTSGWILMDYGDVVVHIFTPTLRGYYNLEGLWAKAPVLLRMQ